MQLFRALTTVPRYPRPSLQTVLTGERIWLRAGQTDDWRTWTTLREQSRQFLQPWEPTWSPDALTLDYFCGNLRRQWREWRNGEGYAWLIFKRTEVRDQRPDKTLTSGLCPLIGGISLNDITRGIAQRGTLGYWIGEPFANQGYMTEAVRLICAFGFDQLRLHRIEASCLPHNEASKRILQKIGFSLEGRAAGYLRINGKWEDHLLWGLVKPDAH